MQWSSTDLTLRDRLGGGNFGQVYEGLINERKGARSRSCYTAGTGTQNRYPR